MEELIRFLNHCVVDQIKFPFSLNSLNVLKLEINFLPSYFFLSSKNSLSAVEVEET